MIEAIIIKFVDFLSSKVTNENQINSQLTSTLNKITISPTIGIKGHNQETRLLFTNRSTPLTKVVFVFRITLCWYQWKHIALIS